MSNPKRVSRRTLIKSGALVAAAWPLTGLQPASAETPAANGKADPWRGLKVGIASYSFRKMPLDATLKAIQRLGLQYMSIKDVHLSLKSSPEERRTVAQKIKEAGITLMSCGNVSMENNEANIRAAFEYARDAGIPTIVCSPHPDSMPILDKMVKEFNIKLAIHNHGPEDKRFPAPQDVWKAVQAFDRRIGLCIDVGHTARAQEDPAEAIRKYRERLYDLHIKDIANSERTPRGSTVEMGRGALNQKAIFRALLEIKYPYLVSFEYEKDADDPLPGTAESVGYAKGLLSCL